jgi:hypothetical protein|tara:strand:- start:52 stop:291 length:240 start_codon:yes stop_codon:yes gene_type:complete
MAFHGEVKKVLIQKTQQPKDVSEALRKWFVSNMKHGRQLVLDFDTMVPTIADYDTADCPIKDLMFDKEKLFADYKKIVK